MIKTLSALMGAILFLAAGGLVRPAMGQDFPPLKVVPDVESDDPQFDTYRQLAEQLTAAKLPPIPLRLSLFAREPGIAYPAIRGWHGSIENVQSIRGKGVLVTVRVSAALEGTTYDSHFCLERYLVSNRGVQFVDAAPPPPGTPRVLFGL